MGGMNSCCIPRYQNPNVCKENHASTPSKSKGHRRNLSAAFNLAEMAADISMEQMNVNTATEEELMTLPGINRQTAVNIVDYRRQIGGFKKVEDLALVSGVGATKLNEIRMEICVKNKKTSQSSSRSSSRTDMHMLSVDRQSSLGHSRQSSGAIAKININSANVFQLMKVKGITQLLAENIVIYRDKKGPFKTVDDLMKVKGITPGVMGVVRPFVILEEEAHPLLSPPAFLSPVDPRVVIRQSSRPNGSIPASSQTLPNFPAVDAAIQPMNNEQQTPNGLAPERSTGASDMLLYKCLPTSSQDDLIAMYGPLLKRSFRRAKPTRVEHKRSQTSIRVGSWNLQGLTTEKAENPGVKEVVCLTVLENG